MALDSVRPLKLEAPGAEGGTQLDLGPTEINPLQDAAIVAGVYVCGPSVAAADKAVLLDRTANSLRLTDGTTSHVLGELVTSTTGQVGSHNALLDIIHFLADGPGDGWASGAVGVDTYSGPLRTGTTWYADDTLAKKIVAMAWTYAGPLVATQKTTLYAADGISVTRTVTDTFSYNGPLRAQRSRVWSNN